MMGMEKMLATMLGITPDEMQATVKGMTEAASGGVELLNKIAAQNDTIIALLTTGVVAPQLEGPENGDGNSKRE